MGIEEFMEKYQTIIYPSAIALFAFGYKLYRGTRLKYEELRREDSEKQKRSNCQKFSTWEHTESLAVLSDIHKKCNLYKDKSKADRVAYIQLENGTVASSKLCNMFISFSCEDSRYSDLPKELLNLRRIPYSRLSAWAEELFKVANENGKALILKKESEAFETINSLYKSRIGTQFVSPVFDYDNNFIGAVVLDFIEEIPKEKMDFYLSALLDFRSAVYNRIMSFHDDRKERMEEFKIKESC